MSSKKRNMVIIIIMLIGVVGIFFSFKYTKRRNNSYIKSDEIVYETDSIEVVHVAKKEFDKDGELNLLAQLGIGRMDQKSPKRDAFIVKTNVDTKKSVELYEQNDSEWKYKLDGWFNNYATYNNTMLCADYVSEQLTYGKPTPCLMVVNLETKQEVVWNISELAGKAILHEEGEQVEHLAWLDEEHIALLAGNAVIHLDVKRGKILEQYQITEEPFVNWNVSGSVLSYVVEEDGKYLFEAIDLNGMKKLSSIDAGAWKPGFGEYDMLYCDGQIYKVDKKNICCYNFDKKKFQKIYSGIKMQETYREPDTGENYYNYCRLYGIEKDCIYVMHISEYAGECNYCRIHKIVLK